MAIRIVSRFARTSVAATCSAKLATRAGWRSTATSRIASAEPWRSSRPWSALCHAAMSGSPSGARIMSHTGTPRLAASVSRASRPASPGDPMKQTATGNGTRPAWSSTRKADPPGSSTIATRNAGVSAAAADFTPRGKQHGGGENPTAVLHGFGDVLKTSPRGPKAVPCRTSRSRLRNPCRRK